MPYTPSFSYFSHSSFAGRLPRPHLAGRLKAILFSLFFLMLWGCGSGQVTREGLEVISQTGGFGTENPESGNYVIKLRDQIRITVREYPELDTTAVVGESGTIYIRLIGEVPALGLNKAQLIKDLTSKFSIYVKEKVTIDLSIINREVRNVTILGSVARQGVYPVPPDGSLLASIALAGGTGSDSDLRYVKIFRSGNYSVPLEVDLTLTLNVSEYLDSRLPTVEPGDIVYIPKIENFIRELAEFLRDSFFLFSLLNFL